MSKHAPFLLIVLLFATSCKETESGHSAKLASDVTVEHIEAAGVEKLRAADPNIVVLDVRTEHEFKQGHIRGAVNIDIQQETFATEIGKLDPAVGYLVHCAAGSPTGRSNKAVNMLASKGFRKLYHLDGGYLAWSQR